MLFLKIKSVNRPARLMITVAAIAGVLCSTVLYAKMNAQSASPSVQADPGQSTPPMDEVLSPNSKTPTQSNPTNPSPDLAKMGKDILNNRCSVCHEAPDPKSHTLYEWPAIINRMAPRANLNPQEMKALKAYISQELTGKATEKQ